MIKDCLDMKYRTGISYKLRVLFVVQTFEKHEKTGLSNRAIYRKYIYPTLGICEKTMYNMINHSCDTRYALTDEEKEFVRQNNLQIVV